MTTPSAAAFLGGHISIVRQVGVGEANLNRGITFLGNNILAKYAHSTGGDIFYGGVSRENLEGFNARVSEQARNQYTIAYFPAQHNDRSSRITRSKFASGARHGACSRATVTTSTRHRSPLM